MAISNLIRLLSDGDFHSGEQLGEHLGISRAAVLKQLKKLEALHISLQAVRGLGYRLVEPIELLNGSDIVSNLSSGARHQLQQLFVEETLSSTNRYLRERFVRGAGHAEVCLAEQQTAGQGRRGRNWLCAWGKGLLLSVGWRFERPASALEGLSLAVGVSVAEVLEKHSMQVSLKWPNDILLRDKNCCAKLAGILLEVSGDLAGPCNMVIGLGLNVSLDASYRQQFGQPVAAVHDQAPLLSRNQLAAELLNSLFVLFKEFDAQGFKPWQAAWNERNTYAGCEIEVFQGEHCYIAKAGGVDEAGNLEIWREDGLHRLVGGEISVRSYS